MGPAAAGVSSSKLAAVAARSAATAAAQNMPLLLLLPTAAMQAHSAGAAVGAGAELVLTTAFAGWRFCLASNI